jgi:molecular chaperone GrpE
LAEPSNPFTPPVPSNSSQAGDVNLKTEVTVENKEPITDEAMNTAPDTQAQERDTLKAERDELKELLLRRQAEFDNFRKRSEREKSEFAQYAGMEIVKELLPVLDDFERALKIDAGNTEYERGVAMIYNRLAESLKKQGLEAIDTEGKIFDPHLHQAVERVETHDAEDNIVLGEFQRGYFFKGKLLRPAMVRVAVNP